MLKFLDSVYFWLRDKFKDEDVFYASRAFHILTMVEALYPICIAGLSAFYIYEGDAGEKVKDVLKAVVLLIIGLTYYLNYRRYKNIDVAESFITKEWVFVLFISGPFLLIFYVFIFPLSKNL